MPFCMDRYRELLKLIFGLPRTICAGYAQLHCDSMSLSRVGTVPPPWKAPCTRRPCERDDRDLLILGYFSRGCTWVFSTKQH